MTQSDFFLLLALIAVRRHFTKREAIIFGLAYFVMAVLSRLGWYS